MCSSCYRRGVWEFAHDHELVRLCEAATGPGMVTRVENAWGDTRITFKQVIALSFLILNCSEQF
jgi:hypothetical protein